MHTVEQAGRRLATISSVHEAKVWVLTILCYGVADSALTTLILYSGGWENSEIARWFVDLFGFAGLFVHKFLFFAGIALVLLVFSHIARTINQPAAPYRIAIALVLLARGLLLIQHHVQIYTALA